MARITVRSQYLGELWKPGVWLARTYWAPDTGGYVYEESPGHPGTLGLQVGERLYNGGSCLTCSGDDLPEVIRRELRRRRDEIRRERRRSC